MKSFFRRSAYGACLITLAAACMLGGSTEYLRAQTATVYNTTDLGTAPPDLTVSVSPNIAVTFDDSGSMGSTGLPDTLDGQQSKRFYYSSTTNFVYYNPAITYTPPLNAAGTARFPDASYTGAWLDGICANAPGASGNNCSKTVNLSNRFTSKFATNTTTGYQASRGGAIDIPSANLNNSNDTGGFYWTCPTQGSESGCAVTFLKDLAPADRQNFANWYSYYRTRNLMTRSAIANVFGGLGTGIRVVYQNLNDQNYQLVGGQTTFDAFTGQARTDFFTWLYQVSASGGTPTRVAIQAAGELFRSGAGVTDNTNPYWEPLKKDTLGTGQELTCRLNYSLLVTDGYWNGDDPGIQNPTTRTAVTLPDGMAYSGSNTDKDSVIYSNVPDGFYQSRNGTVYYSSLSDLAFYYWATNLRPDFQKAGGKPKLDVPPSFVDYTDSNGNAVNWDGTGAPPRSLYYNPKNDPATWPHVIQFMITLGINGSLNYPGDYAALRKGTKSWPMPTGTGNGDLTDIDDTWHAAINSRGQYFSAGDPAQLSSALNLVLARIIARSASTVAGALSSSVLTGNGVTYQTGFDSSNWTGSLVANIVGSDGTIGKQLWSAGDILTAQAKAGDSRVILTSTAPGAGKGAAFRWTNISTALTAADPTFTATNGPNTIAYLRGDPSMEGTTFRRRTSTLGAIINSQSVYVAYPASGYSDSFPASAPESQVDPTSKLLLYSYEKFVNDHAKRAPTIYVGANDGMLHAFDATTSSTLPDSVDVTPAPGKERWAYVPYSVYNKLQSLTPTSNFTFTPTVDSTPVVRDVFFSAGTQGWHSILVGGLRLGGRGIYALDITDASASESSPGTKVLWEFTSNSKDASGNVVGANLGYTYGKPNIGRLANGKWVVLVPSGYFPSSTSDTYKSDGSSAAAARTQSSLFILDAQTGAVIKELVTPTSVSGVGNVTSFGLTSPVLGDYNNDQIDDVAFAGDLQGNLWRFDLSSTDPSKWSVSLAFYSASQGTRPITVMPRLFADPASSYFMVVFGTGKYLGGSDNTTSATQYVYGIRDGGPGNTKPVIEGTTLMVQQLLTEVGSVRGLTTNPVPAADSKGNPYGGWYIQLSTGPSTAPTNLGERVVVDATALFDSGRAIITTLLPGSTDPCSPVRKGAILVIDAGTGGAASGVNVGTANLGAGFTQAGIRVSNVPLTGALPAATAIGGGKISLPGLVITNSDGSTSSFGIGDAVWRRRSWRELNNAY